MRPERVALLPALRGAQPVQRKPKRNANQPPTESAAVAKPFETFVSPEQRFLGHVFGIRRIAQNSARDTVGQRAAFGKALLELPPGIRLSCLAHQLAPCRADWLVQNQLLHRIPSKRSSTGQSKELRPLTTTRRRGTEFGSRRW